MMKRDFEKAAAKEYDLVIVGGGVYGLCTAWDASLRGLSVLVLEKNDFAHASSSANYKLIHGGLRYLQHVDFKRMRRSILERRAMMTMAPHLVAPVAFVIPCYGHGMKGPEVLRVALTINDWMGHDRNKCVEPSRQIPPGSVLSKEECARRIPGVKTEGLTGGAVYYDAQMYSAERLAFSFGLSAAETGATLINYAEVTRFHVEDGQVTAVDVKDTLGDGQVQARGKMFVNMTGPWSEITRELLKTSEPAKHVVRSKGVQFFTRQLADCGFTVETRQKDTTALIARGGRSLFVQPWRGTSFIGQSDKIYRGDPDDFEITEEDLLEFLEEFNQGYPYAKLTREDVTHWLGGMIPVGNDDPNADAANISHKYEILDHAKEDGVENMLSVIGVKFTISRYIAETVVDRIGKKLGGRLNASQTASRRVVGGELEDVNAAIERLQHKEKLAPAVAAHLVHLYGSGAGKILSLADGNPDLRQCVSGSQEVLRAEIVNAVRNEMAFHLMDVLLRRTDLGTLGYPGDDTVSEVIDLMALELGWDHVTRDRERAACRRHYRIQT